MIQATYASSLDQNNTKGLLFDIAFTGNYGVNPVGDTLNLAPVEAGTNAGGVLDPALAYNLILEQPSKRVGVFNANLGGYYAQFAPAANPTLQNVGGLRIFAPGGAELATGVAYPAAVLAGTVTLLVLIPLQ